ncbi:hypothetical protein H0H92_002445 [Tricholoma furcatifolium]|nr:hypothetical protein H0H92_002445 [Tricholoma furcatifolium]
MASPSVTTEAQIRSEIARLTATINQRKSIISGQTSSNPRTNPRSNTYVNPNYRPSNKYIRPDYVAPQPAAPAPPPRPVQPPSTAVKDVIINGIAFESSGRSLVQVRQGQSRNLKRHSHGNLDTLYPVHVPISPKHLAVAMPAQQTVLAVAGLHVSTNMIQPRLLSVGIFFKTTALKPRRRRCTREKCPFPHVNVGTRSGVCRDFAVLGYCEKGLDCDKQHVRECPDFAERGTCGTKGCKLPHVIRANRTRKQTSKSADDPSTSTTTGIVAAGTNTFEEQQAVQPTANDTQLGDEYVSLTFNESESEEDSEEEDEGDDGEEEDEDDDQEGSDLDDVEPDAE